MPQKYPRFSFVHITKDLPQTMSHFPNDFDAIIDGSYQQLYQGDDVKSYSVYMLKDGEVVDSIAWYKEDQLTLLPNQDKLLALDLVDIYLTNT